MDMASVINELKASLLDMQTVFELNQDFSFEELVIVSLSELHRVRPRRAQASITLVAGQGEYTLPVDYLKFGSSSWGFSEQALTQPWDENYPKRLPTVKSLEVNGTKKLILSFAPTAGDISILGETYTFDFYARYSDINQVADEDRVSLLLRARAEAFLALDSRASHRKNSPSKPGSARPVDFLGKYETLMKRWEGMAA